MSASRYDIIADQGSTFKLHFHYKYSGGTGIDLSNFRGDLQVRKSLSDDNVLLYLTNYGVTGGGITGSFTPGINGILGTGGISFNTSISGATAYTGGILLKIDANTMSYVPAGKHFYDLELTNTIGEVQRLVEGTFEVSREITRN
jgi:hypothetical protein